MSLPYTAHFSLRKQLSVPSQRSFSSAHSVFSLVSSASTLLYKPRRPSVQLQFPTFLDLFSPNAVFWLSSIHFQPLIEVPYLSWTPSVSPPPVCLSVVSFFLVCSVFYLFLYVFITRPLPGYIFYIVLIPFSLSLFPLPPFHWLPSLPLLTQRKASLSISFSFAYL